MTVLLSLVLAIATAQGQPSKAGEAVLKQVMAARELPDGQKGARLAEIARTIAKAPLGSERVVLASLLIGAASEGDPGKATLQSAADTLTAALKETPPPLEHGQPAYPYVQLSLLERYEGVRVALDHPDYRRAVRATAETLAARERADFTLQDLQGHTWKRSALKGKVVLLNFWATWCPPCRKEMPDLQALYNRFGSKGLVVLAVSDEDPAKVRPFAEKEKWTFPVLLDKGGVVGKLYRLESLPKSFVYDRSGKLVATGIDMRTQRQFLAMLARAHLP